MATGGAWQSEYFDKSTTGGPGSTAQPPLPPAMGPRVTPPPGMYNVSSSREKSKLGRGTVIASVVLRLLTFVLAGVALALVVVGKGSFGVLVDGQTDPDKKTVRFTVIGAGKYLFVACIVVAVYSLAMIGLSLISLCVKFLANSKIFLWITFLLDQVLAYALVSAGAAAADAVIANKNAENITGFRGPVSCENLGIDGLCTKAAAAVALAFAAFLFLAVTGVLSARRLFRH